MERPRSDSHDWIVDRVTRRRLAEVERELCRMVRSGREGETERLHFQLTAARSKRIRPALLLLAARFGPLRRERDLVSAGAATEAIHEGTLYHDDIVDRSMIRRGMPTVLARFGAQTAAYAGCELMLYGIAASARLDRRERIMVAATGRRLCHAFRSEIESMGRVECTVGGRVRIALGKTSSLFRLAVELGCSIANANRATRRALARFADRFGLAYQMANDLADIFGDPQVGSSPGLSDIRAGIVSLPLAFALDGCDEDDPLRKLVGRAFAEPSDENLSEVSSELVARDVEIRSAIKLFDWTEEARRQLRGLGADAPTGAVRSLDNLSRRIARSALLIVSGPERTQKKFVVTSVPTESLRRAAGRSKTSSAAHDRTVLAMRAFDVAARSLTEKSSSPRLLALSVALESLRVVDERCRSVSETCEGCAHDETWVVDTDAVSSVDAMIARFMESTAVLSSNSARILASAAAHAFREYAIGKRLSLRTIRALSRAVRDCVVIDGGRSRRVDDLRLRA